MRSLTSCFTMDLSTNIQMILVILPYWLNVLLYLTNSGLAEVKSTNRRVATVDGDIILGALFPVHRKPQSATSYTRTCGDIWEQYGMHRIEIFLKTLDEINKSPRILPNITLGCDIRDSCWYPPVALEQSIDFIKNSIAHMEKQMNIQDIGCSREHKKPIAGLIGPGSSTVTVQVQNLLSLFTIPQIGYSATSLDLSDKTLYNYFLRVVPSDKLQARAMVDIVLRYNWTYVSLVYTEGNYGQSGMETFRQMAAKDGICFAGSDKVPGRASDDQFEAVVTNLLQSPNARVVVCFCEGMTVNGLLRATKKLNAAGQFLFLGSDGWADRPDVVENLGEEASGGISIKLYSPPITNFDDHYFSLTPETNTRNPWFKEFWQEKFQCQLQGKDRDLRFPTNCTGKESLRQNYVQDSKLGFVVNAIYTMAIGLHNMHMDVCKGVPGLCEEMNIVNGSTYMNHLLNVSFTTYSNDHISFNQQGDPPGRYDIMNYKRFPNSNGNVTFNYVKVGSWDQGNLTMDDDMVYWPRKRPYLDSRITFIESVCSKPCQRGYKKSVKNGQGSCCWVCTKCKDNEIMIDEETCQECPTGRWPNKELTDCEELHIEYTQWKDSEAVVAIVMACAGIIFTVFFIGVFIKHNNTPVVKASTRELVYIILLGICSSYMTTFPLVAKPTLVTCYLTRIMPGFSFSLIYGALVTKTNRIARILAGSKKKIMTRKPRFMSASAQVVITCIIIGIECAIITVMLILEPADSKLVYLENKKRVKLACNATTIGIIAPLGFDIFLIAMCTLYAIKTRNLPENFNEAKFIGFTMYTTCVIWLAFVPIYFGSENKVITMCLAITLSASVALVLLFVPKIYIIICKPEKNNRSAFTTSKDVRCHIGSASSRVSNESIERLLELEDVPVSQPAMLTSCDVMHDQGQHEKSFEQAALAVYRQKSFFTKWKNKSIKGRTTTEQQHNKFNGRTGHLQLSRPTRPRTVQLPLICASKQPFGRQQVGQVTCQANSNVSTTTSNTPPRIQVQLVSEVPYKTSSYQQPSFVDSAVQTDGHVCFCEPGHTNLRRRIKSSSQNGTERLGGRSPSSQGAMCPYRDETDRQIGSTRRIVSAASPPSYFREEETNCMLQPEMFQTPPSPFTPASDLSPLLSSTDERFTCDSTSEETLSHTGCDDDVCNIDDIDDLLSGACSGSQAGSFSSDINVHSAMPVTVDSGRPIKFTKPRHCTAADYQTIHTGRPSRETRPLLSSEIDVTFGTERLRGVKSAPNLIDSYYDVYSARELPHPYVKRDASPMYVNCTFADRSTPVTSEVYPRAGPRSVNINRIQNTGENKRRSLGASPRSGVTNYGSDDVRMEEFNITNLTLLEDEVESVSKFQEFLHSKGLKLDMTSIQSSDV